MYLYMVLCHTDCSQPTVKPDTHYKHARYSYSVSLLCTTLAICIMLRP